MLVLLLSYTNTMHITCITYMHLHLQAMYSDELKIQEPKGVVSMLLAPSDSSQEAYVQCQLELAVHDQYPEQAPGISLQEARGLGSTRLAALQAELQREASVMLGEMMLGQLFECAKDWLSRNNCPEGEQGTAHCWCWSPFKLWAAEASCTQPQHCY